MASFADNAYLDFFYEPKDHFMRGLWEVDQRPADSATKDHAGFYTPCFMAQLLSERPGYTGESLEAYLITTLAPGLRAKAGKLATGVSEEVFSLYEPDLSDFVPESVPMPDRFSSYEDYAWLDDGVPEIEQELNRALETRGISYSASPSFHRLEKTLDHLLYRAVLGRRYEVTTGLPKLDAWFAEAQTCLQEFVLPNGFGDEVVHRRYLQSQIMDKYYDSDDFFFEDSSELETELHQLPMNVIAAFDGEKLLTVASRREATDIFIQTKKAEARKVRDSGSLPREYQTAKKPSLLVRCRSWFNERRAKLL